jgi:spore maturation protein CgeB
MQDTVFINKNVLLLISTDGNQYLNFLCSDLKKYFNNIHRLNFVEYCCQKGIRNTKKHIEYIISDKEIDIIIASPFATDCELSVEFYASLKDKTKIVFWMFDDEMYFDVYSKYYCQVADAVITADYFSVFGYKKLDIPAIFFCPSFSKNNYYPVKIDKNIDVCFLGDCKKHDRMEYIDFLIENGINVETFGSGSKNGFVAWNEFSKIFSQSKINLNFTKINELSWINKDEPLLNMVRQSKGRPGEIVLTKSFCLSEYAPSLSAIFEIGKEIDVFYNKEELLEKLRYYLSHDDERETIARNAYKRALDNYESEVYLPKLLKELEGVLEETNKPNQKKTEILLSRAFKTKSINGLTFSMFILIKNGKIRYAIESFKELFRYGIFVFFAGFYGGIVRVISTRYNKLLKK